MIENTDGQLTGRECHQPVSAAVQLDSTARRRDSSVDLFMPAGSLGPMEFSSSASSITEHIFSLPLSSLEFRNIHNANRQEDLLQK